ncbi:hypothetical protein D9M70_322520 [compost metagenome]
MVAFQLFFQGAQYLALVFFIFHVDEVDDDDPAQVAQAQLAGNGGGRLEVGLEDGLFEGAVTDERAGVHIDGGHRLGRVDDQIAAGFKQHLALQGLLDLVLDAVKVEDRPLAGVVLQAVGDFRHQLVDELRDLLEGFARIDTDLLDARVDQVTKGTQGQAEVFVDDRGRRRGLHLRGNLLPEAAQVTDVHQDLVGAGTVRRGTQDEAAGLLDAFGGDAVGHHLLEALALGFVLDLQGNAHMAGARHVHQVARRDRQLRGQACALAADGVLGDLHHQALAFMHQGADALDGAALAGADFRGMDEGGTVQPDVDEGRLHPRQYPHDLALVDVADDAAPLRAFDMHLLQHTVFHHRHARFHRRDIDQNLFAHAVTYPRCCQQGMPNPASNSAVSSSGNPTTAE